MFRGPEAALEIGDNVGPSSEEPGPLSQLAREFGGIVKYTSAAIGAEVTSLFRALARRILGVAD